MGQTCYEGCDKPGDARRRGSQGAPGEPKRRQEEQVSTRRAFSPWIPSVPPGPSSLHMGSLGSSWPLLGLPDCFWPPLAPPCSLGPGLQKCWSLGLLMVPWVPGCPGIPWVPGRRPLEPRPWSSPGLVPGCPGFPGVLWAPAPTGTCFPRTIWGGAISGG